MLLKVFPLTKKENYVDIPTEEIINSMNDMSNQIQDKTNTLVLQDLPNDVPRDMAIELSTKLYLHIAKKLVKEIKSIK